MGQSGGTEMASGLIIVLGHKSNVSSVQEEGGWHKFLTSFAGLQVFWWPLLLLSFNYHGKDLAHTENSSQEPGNQQMVSRAKGLNVRSQLYNKSKEVTGSSIYSVCCWHSPPPPTNHLPSLLLIRARSCKTMITIPLIWKLSCYQFSLRKIYTFWTHNFCTLRVGKSVTSQKCTYLKK